MQTNQVDPFQKGRDKNLLEFVNSLFDFARDPKRSGLFIKIESGNNTHIEIESIDEDHVVIKMDGFEMGEFETIEARGYKCSFHQRYRQHIKEELTENESLMKSICNHPLILFYGA